MLIVVGGMIGLGKSSVAEILGITLIVKRFMKVWMIILSYRYFIVSLKKKY